MDERDVVGQLGEMRNQIADPFAGLAALAKRVLRASEIAGRSLKGDLWSAGERLVVPLDEFRLVVPGFELADGARAEDDDDVLGLGGEMAAAGCVWA